MKEVYIDKNFSASSEETIEIANEIIIEYQDQGFDLTLRQLYYQFVARGLIDNDDRQYKRLGSIVNDARLAGLVDWDAIKDRTRFVRKLNSWESPEQIVEAAAHSYHLNRWKHQDDAVEVWIEKDALVGVIEDVCNSLDLPFFSCRGYVSQSAMYEAAQRMIDRDKDCIVLHLGDHDPSGIDMTRDIRDRLNLFADDYIDVHVERIALNLDQVEEMNPPPNPAKLTDARAKNYIKQYGYESWELDAIEPNQLVKLITDEVDGYIDRDAWETVEDLERFGRDKILKAVANFDD